MASEPQLQRVHEELESVIDPCGRHNGTWFSLVDLGMVEDICELGPGRILVRLLLDDPICLYMVDIHTEVRAAALRVPGVEHVDIEVVGDQLWTQDRLSEEANKKIADWQGLRADRRSSCSPLLEIEPLKTPK